ncbi:MAG: MltA-interacting MipA family protein, partial [Gammaproteobacteria bacterium]
MNKIAIIILATMLLAQPLQAADIAGEVRSGADGPDTGDGGFLEIGVRAGAWTHPFFGDGNNAGEGFTPGEGFTLAGQYRFRGFFVEAINSTADGINVGYQLWNNDQWMVDIIGYNATSGSVKKVDPFLDPGTAYATPGTPRPGLWMKHSGTALTGAGLRVTRYFDDYIVQFRVLHDVYHGRGQYASARLGRSWQYRNWNFHAMAGIEYLDSELSLRTFGVTAAEAKRSFFRQYDPGATGQIEAEIGVTYPMSERWVF